MYKCILFVIEYQVVCSYFCNYIHSVSNMLDFESIQWFAFNAIFWSVFKQLGNWFTKKIS